jgi:hypothetical protein
VHEFEDVAGERRPGVGRMRRQFVLAQALVERGGEVGGGVLPTLAGAVADGVEDRREQALRAAAEERVEERAAFLAPAAGVFLVMSEAVRGAPGRARSGGGAGRRRSLAGVGVRGRRGGRWNGKTTRAAIAPVPAASRGLPGRNGGTGPQGHQRSPVSLRAITRRWISLVPS